jgi:alkylated DNA repair dioxygenase AlkB
MILFNKNGTAEYFAEIFSSKESHNYLNQLLKEINWQNDQVIIFGKKIITKRKTAWYGDKNFEYIYSKIPRYALPWDENLIKIKEKIEDFCGEKFNSCLLNLYHNNQESMGWHADDEKSIIENSTIASVSFGEKRKFLFKNRKNLEKFSIDLEDGSLLLMKNEIQKNWLHSLPKSSKVGGLRINLTFRQMKI